MAARISFSRPFFADDRPARRRSRSAGSFFAVAASSSSRSSSWFCNPLDVKALAAPAFILHLWVAELEALVQALARVVELRAVDVLQALRVDHHLHAVALELHVVRIGPVDELELVGHSRAA